MYEFISQGDVMNLHSKGFEVELLNRTNPTIRGTVYTPAWNWFKYKYRLSLVVDYFNIHDFLKQMKEGKLKAEVMTTEQISFTIETPEEVVSNLLEGRIIPESIKFKNKLTPWGRGDFIKKFDVLLMKKETKDYGRITSILKEDIHIGSGSYKISEVPNLFEVVVFIEGDGTTRTKPLFKSR